MSGSTLTAIVAAHTQALDRSRRKNLDFRIRMLWRRSSVHEFAFGARAKHRNYRFISLSCGPQGGSSSIVPSGSREDLTIAVQASFLSSAVYSIGAGIPSRRAGPNQRPVSRHRQPCDCIAQELCIRRLGETSVHRAQRTELCQSKITCMQGFPVQRTVAISE